MGWGKRADYILHTNEPITAWARYAITRSSRRSSTRAAYPRERMARRRIGAIEGRYGQAVYGTARPPSHEWFSTLCAVTIAEQPAEPRVRVHPPDEALRRAKALPPRERLVIEDVPLDDWTAFQEALAEA